MKRTHNRQRDELRKLDVLYDVFPFADGSVKFSLGNTTVLCSVMRSAGVPAFLRGKEQGWLTADYSMLPAATPTRTPRETSGKKSGRAVEISRLLGRALRTVVNLQIIGEYSIYVDCDVICADGGTRTAALCGAYLALRAADQRWQKLGIFSQSLLIKELAALSVGVVDGNILIDLSCDEDNKAQADFNFIVSRSEEIIEVQGGAETKPINKDLYSEIFQNALQASKQVFQFYDDNPYTDTEKLQILCPQKFE